MVGTLLELLKFSKPTFNDVTRVWCAGFIKLRVRSSDYATILKGFLWGSLWLPLLLLWFPLPLSSWFCCCSSGATGLRLLGFWDSNYFYFGNGSKPDQETSFPSLCRTIHAVRLVDLSASCFLFERERSSLEGKGRGCMTRSSSAYVPDAWWSWGWWGVHHIYACM